MIEMKTILFPTDFSRNADNALKYAIKLCELLKSRLIIFHSCHVDAFAYQLMRDETNEDSILENASSKLKCYCESHLIETGSVEIEQVTEYGLAVDSIIIAAEKYKADMIVMGTKGAKNFERTMIGSKTRSVIDQSDCPVFVIPENNKDGEISKIVFATDYRESDMPSIKYLSEIAELFEAEIIIVHVADRI